METRNVNNRSQRSLLPHWDGRFYTRYAAGSYDLITRITGWRRKLVRYALEDITSGRLLDVGCGTGYLMNLARNQGLDVFGVDPSEGMVQKAHNRYRFRKGHILIASAEKLPFENHSFDIVVASGSLVHIPDIEASVKEIVRILKISGTLRIIDHAYPGERNLFTPMACLFSQVSGDILHDYDYYFGRFLKLKNRTTLGRGGYMQRFDFIKLDSR